MGNVSHNYDQNRLIAAAKQEEGAIWDCRKVSPALCGGDVRLISRCRLRFEAGAGLIRFKGAQYPQPVILRAVLFHVRHALSYRDLEEIMAERGVTVVHAALNRWVVRYAPLIAAKVQARKRFAAKSRRHCPSG